MKNLVIIFLSVLAITLTFSGCGESEGSVSAVNGGSTVEVDDPSQDVVTPLAAAGNTSATVAKTPYNLSAALGTPPSIQ